jgi:hypothetical protein
MKIPDFFLVCMFRKSPGHCRNTGVASIFFRNTISRKGNEVPVSHDISRAITMRHGFSRQKFSKKNYGKPGKNFISFKKFSQKCSGKIRNLLKKSGKNSGKNIKRKNRGQSSASERPVPHR